MIASQVGALTAAATPVQAHPVKASSATVTATLSPDFSTAVLVFSLNDSQGVIRASKSMPSKWEVDVSPADGKPYITRRHLRVAGGKFAEYWANADSLLFFQQLDVREVPAR
ncbi:MAG: hypothetical protein ABSA03_04850 [Streptosporangiaceae bacterium]|jgi:hypothetical protein